MENRRRSIEGDASLTAYIISVIDTKIFSKKVRTLVSSSATVERFQDRPTLITLVENAMNDTVLSL